ncbi:MAG: HNH endonuclease signature motif containing protein [Caldilineaceae bacterium]
MAYVSRSIRRKIFADAHYRGGYCLTSQLISGAQLHIEHILPVASGGTSDENNLWVACAWCNGFKGVQVGALDPESGKEVSLFNPRSQRWAEHFRWSGDGTTIIGLTATGRATVIALQLNNEYILPARRHWVSAGWHPPND